MTRKAELFDRRQFFHRRVKFFCQFGTSRKTDVAPTFSLEKVKNLVVKGFHRYKQDFGAGPQTVGMRLLLF